jgi:hypothetical protein
VNAALNVYRMLRIVVVKLKNGKIMH